MYLYITFFRKKVKTGQNWNERARPQRQQKTRIASKSLIGASPAHFFKTSSSWLLSNECNELSSSCDPADTNLPAVRGKNDDLCVKEKGLRLQMLCRWSVLLVISWICCLELAFHALLPPPLICLDSLKPLRAGGGG
ncbi:hypothetical protein GOODEAATRI_002979 [Goodea atripinnis]|uniref:Uncharacterized protein n=1 Tax=Goodea atripinnis TaxID=208336 RepID=A0ABV0MNV8_9TELE